MPLKGTKALETWCKRVTSGYPNVEITNMTSSWRNGLGFCAVIHHHCPDLVNFSSLNPEDVFDNNSLAFQVAADQLGIPSLLDPQDMVDCQTVDKLSILTYLAQYYRALHSPAELQLRLRKSVPAGPNNMDNSAFGHDRSVSDELVDVPKDNAVPDTDANDHTAPVPTNQNIERVRSSLKSISPLKQQKSGSTEDQLTIIKTKQSIISHTIDQKALVGFTPEESPLLDPPGHTGSTKTTEQCQVCHLPVFLLERCIGRGGTLHRACTRCSGCGLPCAGGGFCDLCLQGSEVTTSVVSASEEGESCQKLKEKNLSLSNSDNSPMKVLSAPLENQESSLKNSLELRKAPNKPARTFQTDQKHFNNTATIATASPDTRDNSVLVSQGAQTKSVGTPCKDKKQTETEEKENTKEAFDSKYRFESSIQDLVDLDIRISGLERQGVEMEKKIRQSSEFQHKNSDFDCVLGPKEDDLVVQLFDLVNEKNELVRKQSEIMMMKKERMLEIQQVKCEEQVRVLLEKPAWIRTEIDGVKEEILINKLVEIVTKRNEIVNHLEMDRIREAEEDDAVNNVKLKLSYDGDELQNKEKKTEKSSSRKKLMNWIYRKNE